jgi:rhodanese-related sulfurtransferase
METMLRQFTPDFIANEKHKITADNFLDMKDDAILLDVRTQDEVQTSPIKIEKYANIRYLNIPINKIPDKWDTIPKDKFIAVFCPGGIRAALIYSYLLLKGFENVQILVGGYPALESILSNN